MRFQQDGARVHTDRKNVAYVSKGKAIPLQAWTGPEGCSRLRIPDINTVVT
jgi:hypothetical protein